MIKLNKLSENQYSVCLEYEKDGGSFERDIDGYFYWLPDGTGEFWSADLLLELVGKLKEVNKPYEEELRQKELEKIFGK